MTPEFSRPERVDSISARERVVEVEATAAEREALARRFELVAVDALRAGFAVRREHAGLTARGRVVADVIQACSVTGEPIAVHVDEQADLLFVPAGPEAAEEVELSADALDTIIYEGRNIDLGEAAAETMALALDPFLRAPNADATLRAAGVLSEEEARPPGKLAGLRDKLAGR
ncbi:MAG TPA: DUF177 domain-containing protein [Sphingomonas sp.]|jgi:uncharacterized metal-binding protein YceD (DUF177 family)|uniref:YceD family protein n=1 Tax=Sphingomonas sp. TaxID=28214 RepID=UPI002ED8D10F